MARQIERGRALALCLAALVAVASSSGAAAAVPVAIGLAQLDGPEPCDEHEGRIAESRHEEELWGEQENDVEEGEHDDGARDGGGSSLYVAMVREETVPLGEVGTSTMVHLDEYSIEERGEEGEEGLVMTHRESESTRVDMTSAESSGESGTLTTVVEETLVTDKEGNVESYTLLGSVVDTRAMVGSKGDDGSYEYQRGVWQPDSKATSGGGGDAVEEKSALALALPGGGPLTFLALAAVVSQIVAFIFIVSFRMCNRDSGDGDVDSQDEDMRRDLMSGKVIPIDGDGEAGDECMDCLNNCNSEGEEEEEEESEESQVDDCVVNVDDACRNRIDCSAPSRFQHVEYVPLGPGNV